MPNLGTEVYVPAVVRSTERLWSALRTPKSTQNSMEIRSQPWRCLE
jgi:hypothetical protein